ncbi:MAG: type II toxin-antitoxin system prevent-host-death family antitoxin [Streptosporangiales bacterium]|nr:type II toxin-antitoxin system prevent-host-death family antitoxin [Streptosporangiales bacterium]
MTWQLQEAKQRFSEVLRRAHDDGPQIVTRHGEEVAVVIDISEYRHLTGAARDFKEFLTSGPDFDALELERDREPARFVDLS